MKKLLPVLLLASLTAFGQQINKDIQTTKTSKHINIPGTRVFIVPPPGFALATTIVGLQKGEEAMLMFQDLAGGNFYTNAATFSKSTFEERGLTVFDYQEIKINGHDAKYILMGGALGGKSLALVFGDTTYSVMIMGQNSADEKTGKEIIESLNTIYYDKEKKNDPFENAFFTIDDSKSKFKFFRGMANLFIYTVGGVENDKVAGDPFMVVSPFPGDDMKPKDVADMMMEKQQESGFVRSEMKNETSKKINGHDTYETEIYGQLKEKNTAIYMYVIKKSDKIVCVLGIANNSPEENIPLFKLLAHTVNIK